MHTRSRPSISLLLGIQLAVTAFATAVLVLAPPSHGQMMLVPLWPGAERGMLAHAIGQGATLVAPGPFGSTYLVSGTRETLGGLAAKGVLILAAPEGGCGATRMRPA